jgi:NADP-dependent 3-hydroxy acid dehydrogenase YdfG
MACIVSSEPTAVQHERDVAQRPFDQQRPFDHENPIGAQPVVVVADVGGALGSDVADCLARAGFDVAIVGCDAERVRSTALGVLMHGARSVALSVDWMVASTVAAVADEIAARFGSITAWVVLGWEGGDARDLSNAQELMVPLLNALSAGENALHARGRGRLVLVGSMGAPWMPTVRISASVDAAVRAFADSLRVNLLRQRSSVEVTTVVLPTEPDGPRLWRERSARAVVRAVERGGRRRIVGVRTWCVFQLTRFLPGVCDHLVARSCGDISLRSLARAVADRTGEILCLPPGRWRR